MSTGSDSISECRMKKTAILYITDNGLRLAERLKHVLPESEIVRFGSRTMTTLWNEYSALVFIMAAGIVVRTIAPLLNDKKTDPAVIVLDEAGRFAVSLVGGHLGGANEQAREIAAFLGGEAVITTASDVNGLPSIDIWARDHDLVIEDWGLLSQIGTRFVNNGALRLYSDFAMELPDEFLLVADFRAADIIITNRKDVYAAPSVCMQGEESCSAGACRVKRQLYLRPRNLVIGIGCNSGTLQCEIESTVLQTLAEHNLSFLSIGVIATIDIKGNEPGIRAFVEKYKFVLRTFGAGELNNVEGLEKSDVVFKATGAYSVAEPAALVAAGTDRLIVHKQKKGNVTVAAAEMKQFRNWE
jgi:cobalamin biosynthesis protein CbiG